MKFLINRWPDDETFQPDESWTLIKEKASIIETQIAALPFTFVAYIVIKLLFSISNYHVELQLKYLLPASLIMIILHEPIHAFCFPGSLLSDDVFFGVFPKKFIFFAMYTKELGRNRMVLCLLAPFIIITTLGVLYINIFGGNDLIGNIIMLNALGSCVDLYSTYLLLRQTPRKSKIRNKGIQTYWSAN